MLLISGLRKDVFLIKKKSVPKFAYLSKLQKFHMYKKYVILYS